MIKENDKELSNSSANYFGNTQKSGPIDTEVIYLLLTVANISVILEL